MGKKTTNKTVFENITVLDAGAKGVSVAKAPEGQVIFIPNRFMPATTGPSTAAARLSYAFPD